MSSGNSSVETLLKDAEKLVTRLKVHEKAADCLLGQVDGLHKTIKAKSSYMKEISALNEVARHRPRSELVLGIQMENQQIRRLQAENRDLRMLIDEHQSAVDVIMTKYREQMALILAAKKMNRNGNSQHQAFLNNALRRKRCKIDELASVMSRAIDLDEGVDGKGEEVINRLKSENQTLREMLKICEKKKTAEVAADHHIAISDNEAVGEDSAVTQNVTDVGFGVATAKDDDGCEDSIRIEAKSEAESVVDKRQLQEAEYRANATTEPTSQAESNSGLISGKEDVDSSLRKETKP